MIVSLIWRQLTLSVWYSHSNDAYSLIDAVLTVFSLTWRLLTVWTLISVLTRLLTNWRCVYDILSYMTHKTNWRCVYDILSYMTLKTNWRCLFGIITHMTPTHYSLFWRCLYDILTNITPINFKGWSNRTARWTL